MLLGCSTVGLANTAVTFKDHASGKVLGTITTDPGGNITGSVQINSPSQSVDVTTSGIQRFADFTQNVTLKCGANALGNLTLTPQSGYACMQNCQYPWKTTLQGVGHDATGAQIWQHAGVFGTGGWNFVWGTLDQSARWYADATHIYFPDQTSCPVIGAGTLHYSLNTNPYVGQTVAINE